jgi:hypothetical protein
MKPDTAAAEPTVLEESPEPTAGAETATPEQAPKATKAPKATATAPAAAGALPLNDYDNRTIASVRAGLRNLSLDQLRQLVEYEKSNAGRADFIAMFERRIAKIESEK